MVPSLSWPDAYGCRLSQWVQSSVATRAVLLRGLGHLLACRMRTDKVALSCLPAIMSSQPTHPSISISLCMYCSYSISSFLSQFPN